LEKAQKYINRAKKLSVRNHRDVPISQVPIQVRLRNLTDQIAAGQVRNRIGLPQAVDDHRAQSRIVLQAEDPLQDRPILLEADQVPGLVQRRAVPDLVEAEAVENRAVRAADK
jgi:hypothetical protein